MGMPARVRIGRLFPIVLVAAIASVLLVGCGREDNDPDMATLQHQLDSEKTQTAELVRQLSALTAPTVTAIPDDRAIVTVIGGVCYTGRTLMDARAGVFFPEVDTDAVPINYMTRGVQGSLCFDRNSDCIKNARVGAPLPVECGAKP